MAKSKDKALRTLLAATERSVNETVRQLEQSLQPAAEALRTRLSATAGTPATVEEIEAAVAAIHEAAETSNLLLTSLTLHLARLQEETDELLDG